MSSLYISEIKPLSEVSLANMFSPMVGNLFCFNAVFISHAGAFYFDEIPFLYSFLYVLCSRGHISEKYCCVEYLRFSCLCSSEGRLWCHNLYLSLLFTLNLFLSVV